MNRVIGGHRKGDTKMSYRKYRSESRRLKYWDYSTPGGYFVTMCTNLRRPFFGEIDNCDMCLSPAGEIVKEEWEKTAYMRETVELDEYVIMPNHIHGIIILKQVVGTPRWGVQKSEETKSDSLGLIIGQFKSVCTRRIRADCARDFAWQTRFYDHVIRDETDLQRIRQYIRDNPGKWELDKYYCREK
jgi:REP element-mobilizing transposase RayT